MAKPQKIGRDAGSGKFIPVKLSGATAEDGGRGDHQEEQVAPTAGKLHGHIAGTRRSACSAVTAAPESAEGHT